MSTTDVNFRSLTDQLDILDCYHEMRVVAQERGLAGFPAVEAFPTLEAGHKACEDIHAAIQADIQAAA